MKAEGRRQRRAASSYPIHPSAFILLPCFGVVMNVLGVILARANSTGLKNKHLLPLLGRPVIKYTFAHARQAKLLTRVVVSTDSPQIRRLSEANFFETVRRPAELATADASVQDAMLHA